MNIELYNQEITHDLMTLLLMADPDEKIIRKYIDESTIFVAKESDLIVGIAVITLTDQQYELKNLAVVESYQGKGIAKQLIAKSKAHAKQAGAQQIIVATANSSLSQLALYQKCGFRMQAIQCNYFEKYADEIFENGIRGLDLVVLSAQL